MKDKYVVLTLDDVWYLCAHDSFDKHIMVAELEEFRVQRLFGDWWFYCGTKVEGHTANISCSGENKQNSPLKKADMSLVPTLCSSNTVPCEITRRRCCDATLNRKDMSLQRDSSRYKMSLIDRTQWFSAGLSPVVAVMFLERQGRTAPAKQALFCCSSTAYPGCVLRLITAKGQQQKEFYRTP